MGEWYSVMRRPDGKIRFVAIVGVNPIFATTSFDRSVRTSALFEPERITQAIAGQMIGEQIKNLKTLLTQETDANLAEILAAYLQDTKNFYKKHF